MKSFIKSHKKSSSTNSEYDSVEVRVPVTPQLNQGSLPSFSPRQTTPTSSPVAQTHSAFTTSPLAPPPQQPTFYGRVPLSPSLHSMPQLPTADQLSSGKMSRFKGLLKHKGSKGSLTSPTPAPVPTSTTKPSSPVVPSKSFVTYSDSNLLLPSQTPDFVVDRPHLNSIHEETLVASHPKNFFKVTNGSMSTTSITSLPVDEPSGNTHNRLHDDDTIDHSFLSHSLDNNSIDRSQYSFQSSQASARVLDHDGTKQPQQEELGEDSDRASQSSEFSFEANKTYGRSTSIKYYKKKEDVERERAKVLSRGYIEEFIGEDADVEEFNDDVNYDDSDVEDDTQDLFNRKLFSSDEEDVEDIEGFEAPGEEDYELDTDDALDEVNADAEDEMSGGEVTVLDIVDSAQHEQYENYSSEGEEEIHELPQRKSDDHLVNHVNKRMSHLTVDPPLGIQSRTVNMSSSQRNKLGLNIRTNSLKYHQLRGNSDDELKFLSSRYAWHDEDHHNEKSPESDQHLKLASGDIDTSRLRDSFSSSDKCDDSLLDEINQMPEDFDEFDFISNASQNFNNGAILKRKISNSARAKQIRDTESGILAPSSRCGTKFDNRDKTVTLFRVPSSGKKINQNNSQPAKAQQALQKLSQGANDAAPQQQHHFNDLKPQSAVFAHVLDEDDDSSTLMPINGPPNIALSKGHDSPLTTISEGSFDGSFSPGL